MKRHKLVLSDVHLTQAHPFDPADPMWMRYRRREHHPDAEFAALVDHLLDSEIGEGDELEIVFNGDVFDFDHLWVKDGESTFEEFPPTDEGCTAQIRLILADHQPFFGAVAKALAAGHLVTFMSGNHDIELYWPGVRRAIREELERLVRALPPDARRAAVDVERSVRFRAWFHITDDDIYFEHGSQYDIYNSVRHAAVPLTPAGDRIHPVLGKLAFRRLGARMGYFNPYYEETFYMGATGYIGHFLRFYAFSKTRHICREWLFGALATVAEIWKHRHHDERLPEGRVALRAELGRDVSDEAIDATHHLRTELAETTMVPVFRELWVDRIGFIFAGIVIVSLTALFAGLIPAAIVSAVLAALFVVYELVTPKPDIRTYDSAPPTVLNLFDIHRVRAICMGHTHRPFARFSEKGLYANSGSWCPAFHDQECTKPVLERRPVLWITTEGKELWGGLHWWKDGSFAPDPEASKPARRTEVDEGSSQTAVA